MRVNARGVFLMSRAVAPVMIDRLRHHAAARAAVPHLVEQTARHGSR